MHSEQLIGVLHSHSWSTYVPYGSEFVIVHPLITVLHVAEGFTCCHYGCSLNDPLRDANQEQERPERKSGCAVAVILCMPHSLIRYMFDKMYVSAQQAEQISLTLNVHIRHSQTVVSP